MSSSLSTSENRGTYRATENPKSSKFSRILPREHRLRKVGRGLHTRTFAILVFRPSFVDELLCGASLRRLSPRVGTLLQLHLNLKLRFISQYIISHRVLSIQTDCSFYTIYILHTKRVEQKQKKRVMHIQVSFILYIYIYLFV